MENGGYVMFTEMANRFPELSPTHTSPIIIQRPVITLIDD